MLIPFSLNKSVTYRFFRLLTLSTMSILLFIVFIASSATWSATYSVDTTNGRDTNSGLSEAVAWKTIAKVNAVSI